MTKKIIVTGADGQLGQTLIKYLLDTQSHLEIVATVRHKSVANNSYIFDMSKVTFDVMDLNDVHSIENLVLKYRPAYFVNTAACAFVGESWAQPVIHQQQNCLAVLHQLEAIRKHSPQTRYVNMGTSEEFAVCDKSEPQNEDTKIAPRSPYGCSKAGARYLVDVYRESYGIYAIQPWCFNFEGPLRGAKYLTKKCTLAVARIAKSIREGQSFEPLEVGNIYSFRSWQSAEDVADGMWRSLNQELYREDIKNQPDALKESSLIDARIVGDRSYGFPNIETSKWLSQFVKPYVFSSEDTHDVKTFIESAFRVAGIQGLWSGEGVNEVFEFTYAHIKASDGTVVLAEPGIVSSEYYVSRPLVRINSAFYRPLDVTYLHGDATAARRDLGWSPKVTFDELVNRMVRAELAAVGI